MSTMHGSSEHSDGGITSLCNDVKDDAAVEEEIVAFLVYNTIDQSCASSRDGCVWYCSIERTTTMFLQHHYHDEPLLEPTNR